MFLKPLEVQSRGKTLEIIIAKRMENMVRFENKNITFVDEIHFEKSPNNLKKIKNNRNKSKTIETNRKLSKK